MFHNKCSFTKILMVVFIFLTVLGCKNKSETNTYGFISIFNGKNLDNWEGNPIYWSVNNGSLIGEVTPETLLKRNTFIIWKGGTPSNFELKLDFKISDKGNSGINYRSAFIDSLPHALKGFQGDIDGRMRYTGMNYEERGRTTLASRGEKTIVHPQPKALNPDSLKLNIKNNRWQSLEVIESLGNPDDLAKHIKPNNWNSFHIIANGNRLKHFVNGILMSDVTDKNPENHLKSGFIGLQVHTGPPMKVEFKNIRLKEL
ncbi:DUF1080 domain-containing protein [Flavobacteriaceae bacterium GSB9]|nr:DUF1080 domain-containing protein [Flavobacteriaceae bacterium GSB9]